MGYVFYYYYFSNDYTNANFTFTVCVRNARPPPTMTQACGGGVLLIKFPHPKYAPYQHRLAENPLIFFGLTLRVSAIFQPPKLPNNPYYVETYLQIQFLLHIPFSTCSFFLRHQICIKNSP